jgi:ABC-type branched-subunit amino acid transport system ATPase component
MLLLKNVSFGFSFEKRILENIDLLLEKGKIYALMGSNGAGKTTLFNILTGYIKPLQGNVYFNGKSINDLAPYKINRLGIGRTFQNLRIITKLTVIENVILSMNRNPSDNIIFAFLPDKFKKRTNQQLTNKADEIIKQFFIGDVRDSLAGNISYGQQKLLTLACCIANGADIFLLDEPAAGVQPKYRKEISHLIKQLKEKGKTVFLIEHNTDFVAGLTDQIFLLHGGKILNFANMQALKANRSAIEKYI